MIYDFSISEPSVFTDGFDSFEKIVAAMYRTKGVDLFGFKQDFLRRRIQERIVSCALEDLDAYARRVQDDPLECEVLFSTLGIQVTSFFRDPHVFGMIESRLLPELAREQRAGEQLGVRIWSAGCSSGEEAYSMAMLGNEVLRDWGAPFAVFGTDTNREALEIAQRGVYARDKLLDMRLRLVDAYFRQVGEEYLLLESVKNAVQFSHADLTAKELHLPEEGVFNSYDLVLCRNVLIYYQYRTRQQALKNLAQAISVGGYLVLGESECLPDDYRKLFSAPFAGMPIYKKL